MLVQDFFLSTYVQHKQLELGPWTHAKMSYTFLIYVRAANLFMLLELVLQETAPTAQIVRDVREIFHADSVDRSAALRAANQHRVFECNLGILDECVHVFGTRRNSGLGLCGEYGEVRQMGR